MDPFRRRWLSFSLRGLLAAVTLICVWFGWNVERKRGQQETIAAIHELGGEVGYETSPSIIDLVLFGPDEPIEVNLVSRSPPESLVGRLRGFKKLRTLRLRGAYVTDEGIAGLGAMTSLETLELFYPFITDESLVHLSRLVNLRKLTITDARLTDKGLEFLESLQQLQELTLKNVPITSAGLRRFSAASRLTSLNLNGSLIDENAIAFLAKLKGLRELEVDTRKISTADLAALRMAMPWCKVAASQEERWNAQIFLRGDPTR